MAKEIGIQTLAEGVETEEQFLFLKYIGCEKIQGYYFGRPMPLKETITYFRKRGLRKENAQWTGYFDALGRINYLTDQPLCVIDDDGTRMKMLFCNREYRDIQKLEIFRSLIMWRVWKNG